MASVIVTGANRGIGLATCVSLGRAGHTVFGTVRDPERATDLHGPIDQESLPISVVGMDVDSDDSVATAMGTILGHGPVDALVNNAGIERRGSTEELDLAVFRQVMETNYFGAIRCMQSVLPSMRARGSGCIVNVTSVAGRIATSPLGPYTASKHALEALSETVAQEVKPFGIRVAIVEPGIIDTDMARGIMEAGDSLYPQGRRFSELFTAALESPTGPELVGDAIRDIVESDSWQLRYPVGPDAGRSIAWRASLTDEEWIDWNAADDETWYDNVERDRGLDLRPRD